MKMKVYLKVRPFGNSFGIVLPKSALKALGITEKDVKNNRAYVSGILEGKRV